MFYCSSHELFSVMLLPINTISMTTKTVNINFYPNVQVKIGVLFLIMPSALSAVFAPCLENGGWFIIDDLPLR